MKLTNKEELSRWAFWQCYKGNDTEEMRSLITHSEWAYWYCKCIKDIEEMWSKINNPNWAYLYCIYVKNRLEVRKYMK